MNQGIGQEVAIELSKYNINLVVTDINPLDETIKLVKNINKDTNIFPIQCDISTTDNCEDIIKTTIEIFDKIDIIICNAAYSPKISSYNPNNVEDEEETKEKHVEVFEKNVKYTIDVNYKQNIYLAYHGIPYLKKSKGSMFSISSLSAILGSRGFALYAGSKCAIHGLFTSLNTEYEDISFSVIPLPLILTDRTVINGLNNKSVNSLSPNEAAKRIVNCLKYRNKNMITISIDSVFALWLSFLFPSIMRSIVNGFMKKNFNYKNNHND
eukprot:TRINITY_DN4956_c0_g1_i2.p1 TRINITY_DN4956_c0_g1~~TRINITY_DN4956_c0_g1_i2.p1  ORF type:complete len:268 (+),score=43.86 TRINITY_DN4956_c0_g1_i2:72-875(+)